VRQGADRSGPEFDRDRVAVEHADADRPFQFSGELDRERASGLDDLRNAPMGRCELVHPTRHPVAAAHVVARDVAFGDKRLQHPHDGRFWKAGRFVNLLDGRDAQSADGTQHIERAAHGLHRRIGPLCGIGRAAPRIRTAASFLLARRPPLRKLRLRASVTARIGVTESEAT